jgi:homoserine kinase
MPRSTQFCAHSIKPRNPDPNMPSKATSTRRNPSRSAKLGSNLRSNLRLNLSSNRKLHLELPATSANLGPAFDAAALAMNFYIKVDARLAKEFSISATGRDREICSRVDNHLILKTYSDVLEAAGKPVLPLALRIANDIPIGKGCGSSAAARLAGVALAVHFGKLRWTDAQVIGEASRREQHPDNASACWMGGITVARMSGEAEAEVVNIHPKGKWPLLLAVPDQSLATEEARRAIPTQHSHADAVANVRNSMLLLAALTQGRHELLAPALEDRIHQPYRAALCPLLPSLQELQGTNGIAGAALSGAGPSVLMFLAPQASLAKVKRAVAEHLSRRGLVAELISTSITLRGAKARGR